MENHFCQQYAILNMVYIINYYIILNYQFKKLSLYFLKTNQYKFQNQSYMDTETSNW